MEFLHMLIDAARSPPMDFKLWISYGNARFAAGRKLTGAEFRNPQSKMEIGDVKSSFQKKGTTAAGNGW
jgi:hypothetical protein